jgi:polyvinyl alcohol dehydrogenase (cytochrome)
MKFWCRKLLFVLVPATLACAVTLAATDEGAALYSQHCAQCHDTGANRAPLLDDLEALTSDEILSALQGGVMRKQGAALTLSEREALSEFLSAGAAGTGAAANGSPASAANAASAAAAPAAAMRALARRSNLCRFTRPALDLSAPHWNGWGNAPTNNRRISPQDAGLTAAEVPKLHLKWAFGFPGATSAAVQPTVVGRWVFVGSTSGRVYALDLDEGCVYWTFDAGHEVRTAVTIAPIPRVEAGGTQYAAYFADVGANVYSVNPVTGGLRWKQRVGDAAAGDTGSPTVFGGRIYVPLTAGGEGAEGGKAHGAIVALDADTGRQLWLASTLAEPPQPTGHDEDGNVIHGPNGVSVWSAPTVDAKTNRVYVGTGDSHADPAGPTSDSILAFDMNTGAMVWAHQATAHDAYSGGCDRPDLKGCPDENGPDFDFGEAPALVSLPNSKRLLIVGQKSGLVFGLDPDDKGREVWRARLGSGGVNGGINWGVATDDTNVYVAVSDHLDILKRDAMLNPHAGGLAALRLTDGKQLWRTNVSACAEHQGSNQLLHPVTDGSAPPDFGCSTAQSAAVTLIPGVAFSGSLDGHIRAYATSTGRVLWDFDTARDFYTVNYVEARGGSIDVGGPAIVNGILLTTSGYAKWGGMHGNVLLAFSAEPER